ncbi:molecular chaperone HscC [Gorillibacterium sp. sgz5001074]|uniref:molecular chaperone HscC n=1 Tax=Gorillibacterium sp. sgz5001074 TaxID=3446695 RepID=UPI003F673F3D
MSAMIGIDLGTSNSLIAYWDDHTQGPVMIPNVHGDHLTPSVISIDDNGEIIVGTIAKERLITHPQVTVAAFKRFMGSEKRFELGRHSFSPEELSSFVLRSLKADAEAFLGHTITEAIISVPAYFNDTQRKATKRSAELAGLKVERLINEPTAAALSYGLHLKESDTKFLVFDLGGGTFDVSILELFENVMEVKSIAGDNYLGGEDFTELLVSHLVQTHSIDVHSLDKKAYSALIKQAELCKTALSKGNTGTMTYMAADGQPCEVTLDRAEFEKLAGPLLLRLRHPIERALHDASFSPNEIDAVILIGGATRMPMIKSVVSRVFGRLPYTQVHPDEAVALGAAIQAAMKGRNQILKEVILTDVCPYTLGTDVARETRNNQYDGGYFHPIIERNSPIPISRVERFYTVRDNQTQIELGIYQGENRRVENNLKLGNLLIEVPSAPKGEEPIDVRYTYDINGILEVEVTIVRSGLKKRMVIERNPGTLSEKEIEARLLELSHMKIHPRDREENRLLLARGERIYEEALGDKRKEISYLLNQFEDVLRGQQELEIKKAAALFKQQLDSLERWS